MAYSDRIPLYREIERIRGHPLIVYIISNNPTFGGQMGSDVIPELCDQINMIPDSVRSIDILVVSQGGDIIVPWRIMGILRERFKKIGLLIPYSAQSAATLLAFGADEILMHPFACLGPIDPQINLSDSNKFHFVSVEDIKCFIEFAKEDLDLKGDDFGKTVLEKLCSTIEPVKMGNIKKSMKLSDNLAEKLLKFHMKGSDDDIKKIVDDYNNKSHHGYTVSRTEAIETGLPVKIPSKKMNDLMWEVWEDTEKEMRCRVPFIPKSMVDSNNGSYCDNYKVAVMESKSMRSVFEIEVSVKVQNINTSSPLINVETIPKGWVKGAGNE